MADTKRESKSENRNPPVLCLYYFTLPLTHTEIKYILNHLTTELRI